jgi:hypothetical protein
MGARGRIGLFELARMTPALGELVLARSSQEQLQRAAFPGGGALLACALARAREGAIGYEELPGSSFPEQRWIQTQTPMRKTGRTPDLCPGQCDRNCGG